MAAVAEYSIFLLIQLAVQSYVIDPDLEYDKMWETGKALSNEFIKSSFNISTESEYDCIVSFLNTKKTFDEE